MQSSQGESIGEKITLELGEDEETELHEDEDEEKKEGEDDKKEDVDMDAEDAAGTGGIKRKKNMQVNFERYMSKIFCLSCFFLVLV